MLYVSGDRLISAEWESGPAGIRVAGRKELFRERALRSAFPLRASYDVSADGERIVMRRMEREAGEEPVSVHVVENWREVFRDRLER